MGLKLEHFRDPNPTKIKYPILTYAHGHYSNICYECDKRYMGDKYSQSCEPCAINKLNESHKQLLIENKKLKEDIETLKKAIKLVE